MSSKTVTVNPKSGLTIGSYFDRILLLRIIFGYNFVPFKTNRCVGYLIKAYCVSLSISTSAYIFYRVDDISIRPYVFVSLEYVITVFISCFTSHSYRVNFFGNVEKLDSKLCIGKQHYKHLRSLHYVVVLAAVVSRAFYATSFCYCFIETCSPVKTLISGFVAMAVDVNQLPRAIIFYMCHHQMKALRLNLEKRSQRVSTVDESKYNSGVLGYLDNYKDILDNMEAMADALSPMFFLSLICCVPKIMILVYNILLQSKSDVPIVSLLILGIEAIQWGCLPCLPGIVAENTSSEVDKIKKNLMNQLLEVYDKNRRQEYQDFIQYLEVRPYRYSIWKMIPVDMRLPVGLLSLCTTYLIVVIQFTHLFG